MHFDPDNLDIIIKYLNFFEHTLSMHLYKFRNFCCLIKLISMLNIEKIFYIYITNLYNCMEKNCA